MDPLSITAATIGITAFALTSIRQLRDTINDVAEVKEVIGDVSTDLTGILAPLDSLRELLAPNSNISAAAKADLEKTGVAGAVNECGDRCNDFAKRLEKWTKHSSGSKLSFRDRLTVSVNKDKIHTLRVSLQSCQFRLISAVQTTQLMVQLRSEQSSDADRQSTKQRLQVLKTKIEDHREWTQQLSDENIDRRDRLQVAIAEAEDEAQGDLAIAIREVDEQDQILEEDFVSSTVLHAQVHAKLAEQTIGNVMMGAGSITTVGLPKSAVGKMNQHIGNVTAESSSRGAVGVYPDDFKF